MKGMRRNIFLTALLIGSLAAALPQGAAASTPPCTQISNQATLSYSVGAVAQTPITSALGAGNQFYVGVKVIVTVANTDADNVPVTAGSTPAVLTFTVRNDGNAVHDYALSYQAAANGVASPHPGGGNDSFNGTTVGVYVENGLEAGYQASGANQDTATSITDLARDGAETKTVYIVYTPTDLTAANGSVAVYYLTATTKWADGTDITAGSGTPSLAQAGGACDGAKTVDVVFGDVDGPSSAEGNRDGAHSDDSAYIVTSAAIGVTKSYTVRWDPINYGTSPKAIPGALVEYSITVANTGGTAAILTAISDTLDVANLTLASTFYDGAFGTATPTSTTSKAFIVTCSAGCGARACEVAGGTSFTSAVDSDGIDFSTPTITATMGTVLPSEDTGNCAAGSLGATTDTVTVKFQANIK
jgi:hypothetical protein